MMEVMDLTDLQGYRCSCGHIIAFMARPEGGTVVNDSHWGCCANRDCPHSRGANWVATTDPAILKPVPAADTVAVI